MPVVGNVSSVVTVTTHVTGVSSSTEVAVKVLLTSSEDDSCVVSTDTCQDYNKNKSSQFGIWINFNNIIYDATKYNREYDQQSGL